MIDLTADKKKVPKISFQKGEGKCGEVLTQQKLFRVWSKVPTLEVRHIDNSIRAYKDVGVSWFVYRREKPVMSYEIGIKDYKDCIAKGWPSEEALDENFLLEEALMFQKFYAENFLALGEELVIGEVKLPLKDSWSSIMDYYEQTGEEWGAYLGSLSFCVENYNLPFEVYFIFDLYEYWKRDKIYMFKEEDSQK